MTFASSEKKGVLKDSSGDVVRIEKDVYGTLLAETNKSGKVIDIDKADVPRQPSLCFVDQTKTQGLQSDTQFFLTTPTNHISTVTKLYLANILLR